LLNEIELIPVGKEPGLISLFFNVVDIVFNLSPIVPAVTEIAS